MIEGQHHHSQGVAWALVAVEEVEHTRARSQRPDWLFPYLPPDCASNESEHDGSVGAANTRLAQAFEGLNGCSRIERFHPTFLCLFVEHVRGFLLVQRHF